MPIRRPGKNKLSIKPLSNETFLAMLEHSAGSRVWQRMYARVNGQRRDILHHGELSCAFYVSSLLRIFGWLKEVHATVDGTIKDLHASGWRRTTRPRPGDVVEWAPITYQDGEVHRHLGFYLDRGRAISTSFSRRTPIIHHLTYGRRGRPAYRRIVNIYARPHRND